MSAMPGTGILPNNGLLARLPLAQARTIEESCERVSLQAGEVLGTQATHEPYVYFPLTALVSLVVRLDGHPPLDLALIGNEGMLGATLGLGSDRTPIQALVQVPGLALRMQRSRFAAALGKHKALAPLLGRYLQVLLAQFAQGLACTRFHEVDARLVRLLLTAHDRVPQDTITLTHQVLSEMLGVQRSAVTIAAGTLQKRQFIRYTRGNITILDRRSLEALSCECYLIIATTYLRHLDSRKAA